MPRSMPDAHRVLCAGPGNSRPPAARGACPGRGHGGFGPGGADGRSQPDCHPAGRFPVDATAHRLQQLTGVVEVAAPQQRRAFAGQPVGGVSFCTVVRDDDPPGKRCRALGMPAGGSGGVGFGPVDRGHHVLLVIERAGARRALRRGAGETARATTRARVSGQVGLPLPRRSARGEVAENHAERHDQPFQRDDVRGLHSPSSAGKPSPPSRVGRDPLSPPGLACHLSVESGSRSGRRPPGRSGSWKE